MRRVKVFTDSTADLAPSQLKQLNISVIPLYVTIGDKSYRDGIDITTDELYKMVNQVQTSRKLQHHQQGFCRSFQPWIDNDYDVIFIGIIQTVGNHSIFFISQ